MTKVIKRQMYCKNCKSNVNVPVVLSTNSFMLERDPKLKEKFLKGELFKNVCPVCGSEIEEEQEENQ